MALSGLRSGMTSTGAGARAVASYNRLLLADEALAQRTHESLSQAQRASALLVAGRPLCSVLRPRLLSTASLASLRRSGEIVAGVLERMGRLLLTSDKLLDRIGATEQEREIWSVDPGYEGMALTSRLDSFMVDEEPRFVEFNAESPAGIGFCDRLSDVFWELPAMKVWAESRSIGSFQGLGRLLETLLWAYRQWGGRGAPAVAVVDWESVITRRDFELCAEFFRQNELSTVICDPRRLEYRGGRLWLDSHRIDLVYRRVLLHELLEKADEAAGLLDAYREGAVCMVNSPRSKLLHKKVVFALLDEHRSDLQLTSEEEAVLQRSIPWTRLVSPGKTTWNGQSVDLEKHVRSHRHDLALKPVDDYGGRGVVLGWETSDAEWDAAVGAALEKPYVVQERVPLPEEEFPVWEGGRAQCGSFWVDTDPLLFRGELGGILTRISASALLNVSAGAGSSTPTFVLEED